MSELTEDEKNELTIDKPKIKKDDLIHEIDNFINSKSLQVARSITKQIEDLGSRPNVNTLVAKVQNTSEFTEDDKQSIVNLSNSRTNKEIWRELRETLHNKTSATGKIERKRLKKKHKIIFGKGISPTITTNTKNPDDITSDTNKNIYIELSKLKKNNILSIKYKSNHNNHPKFTQQ